MRLILLRHGETAHNAGSLALGREDVALNDVGLRQAERAAAYLAGQPIAAIFASPLQRAVATVTPLAERLGLDIVVEQDLIEMDVGEMEGRTFEELRESHTGFLREWRSERVADLTMPGGESLSQVQARAWDAIERIKLRHQNETVLAVSHNFVIVTLLCRVMGIDLANFRRVRQDLGAISMLELADERNVVISLNDRCHLEPDGAPV